ncbi:MAG: TonB-dependent receptor [Pseudomonadales bacterium]
MNSLYTAIFGAIVFNCQAVSVFASDKSDSDLEEIIITSHPLSGEGLSQAVELLQGEELQRSVDTNIGSTLNKLPGVHSSGFGKAVGRPVIHGLGGPRVRIMEDRIDAMDLSVTSADHAVGVDPFVAEKIEVLKGASTLLYGSGAIGGVVDIHTGRIPHSIPEQPISGGIESRYDFNTNGNATALKLNGALGSFAWHIDGSVKDGDAYEIPGFAESAELRALEELEAAAGGEEEEEGEEARDILPGSQFELDSFAVGGSYIADWGFAGISFSRMTGEYGLPGGHGHEEEHDEEEEHEDEEEVEGTPLLELEQDRVDFELGIENPFSVFESLNVRVGINDYEHEEIEPNGEIATEFSNEAWEARGELVYQLDNWKGVIGLQIGAREFSALGEEAFIAPVDTDEYALFWLGERSVGIAELEVGARVGEVNHEPENESDTSFTSYSLSAGLVIPVGSAINLGLLFDYSARAPVAEELYSNGAHLVTSSFELGNASLDSEKAANIAATLEYQGERLNARSTLYYTYFSDFIYQQADGDEMDGFPVLRYQQDDATYFGIDAEFNVELSQFSGGDVNFTAQFDYVNASLDVSGNDHIPRTPPLRVSAGLNGRWGAWNARLDFSRVDEQDDTAPLELRTEAYNDVSSWIGYEIGLQGDTSLQLFLQGKNLSDDEQRQHVSFIKDFAPAPGRTIVVGAQLSF